MSKFIIGEDYPDVEWLESCVKLDYNLNGTICSINGYSWTIDEAFYLSINSIVDCNCVYLSATAVMFNRDKVWQTFIIVLKDCELNHDKVRSTRKNPTSGTMVVREFRWL